MNKALKLLGVSLFSVSLLLPATGWSADPVSAKRSSQQSGSRSPASVLTSEELRNPISDRLIVEQAGPVALSRREIIPQLGPVRIDPDGKVPRSLSGNFSRLDNYRAF